jgi:hypothetical protein
MNQSMEATHIQEQPLIILSSSIQETLGSFTTMQDKRMKQHGSHLVPDGEYNCSSEAMRQILHEVQNHFMTKNNNITLLWQLTDLETQ